MTKDGQNMNKEKKDIKIQIRITSTERDLLEKIVATNNELTMSRILRDGIRENCEKLGIKINEGIGNFMVG